MYEIVLVLHVLGATIWTGGHLVLTLTVLPRGLRAGRPDIITDFEAGYEKIGMPALLVQIVTGLWMAYRLVPSPIQWFTFQSSVHAYIGIKVVLLLATFALAMNARLRVIPRLTPETLDVLAWHVRTVTVIAVLFVILGVGLRVGGF